MPQRHEEQHGAGGGRGISTGKTKTIYVRASDIKENDVLCGRGDLCRHPGNEVFRELVSQRQVEYVTTSTQKLKRIIACDVIDAVKGRFLSKVKESPKQIKERKRRLKRKTATTMAADLPEEMWYVISHERALEKACQALRNGAPQLREQLTDLMEENSHSSSGGKNARKSKRRQPFGVSDISHHPFTKRRKYISSDNSVDTDYSSFADSSLSTSSTSQRSHYDQTRTSRPMLLHSSSSNPTFHAHTVSKEFSFDEASLLHSSSSNPNLHAHTVSQEFCFDSASNHLTSSFEGPLSPVDILFSTTPSSTSDEAVADFINDVILSPPRQPSKRDEEFHIDDPATLPTTPSYVSEAYFSFSGTQKMTPDAPVTAKNVVSMEKNSENGSRALPFLRPRHPVAAADLCILPRISDPMEEQIEGNTAPQKMPFSPIKPKKSRQQL